MGQPAEILRNGQVELRRWRATDLDPLHRAIEESLDHLMPWMPWAAVQERQQTAAYLERSEREWDSGEVYGYAITTEDTVVGSCGLARRIGPGGLDIGYWLHPAWTGHGLATLAVEALVRQGFALPGIDRLEIVHDEANLPSAAIPRRLGFTEVARHQVPGGPTAPGEVGIDVIWRMHKPTTAQHS
ncbi:GNAT family N-acetyltransferase [Streptomyces sp. NPDC021098]|uniref:GNAT family N-acetyltransferase n=1 Tax=unclassified Streptomyces TaxID=2593676 RepID=UPI0037A6AD62